MRTAICLLLLPVACLAEAPKDKYTLPKSQLEAILLKDRDANVKKLQAEVEALERAIADVQPAKPKRGTKVVEVSRKYDSEASGFKLPLSKADATKAKAKVKELNTEIAKLKAQKAIVPEVEFASLIPKIQEATERGNPDADTMYISKLGVCKLVEMKSNTTPGSPAIPLFVTVEKMTEKLLITKHGSGTQIVIKAETAAYHAGQVLTLDMPIRVEGPISGGRDCGILVQLFEN